MLIRRYVFRVVAADKSFSLQRWGSLVFVAGEVEGFVVGGEEAEADDLMIEAVVVDSVDERGCDYLVAIA